ncbi:hypothetical protein [Sphingobium sp. MI1205]|nr:hypothetical protein [Sphingobium sp. MI1205]
MSWLPRFGLLGAIVPGLSECDDFHGWALIITWGRWTLDITIARRRP